MTISERAKQKNAFYRNLAIEAYGGYHCACCGETESKFLTLDHVNNDGYKNRIFGRRFYVWLHSNGYPKGLQILCWNCNCGKYRNGGICPHKQLDL